MGLLKKKTTTTSPSDVSVESSSVVTEKKNNTGRDDAGSVASSHVSTSGSIFSKFTARNTKSRVSDPPASSSDTTMLQSRMQQALQKEQGGDRSEDLALLSQAYSHMQTDLSALLVSVRDYHTAMTAFTEARKTVAGNLSSLSLSSPIHGSVGALTRNAESVATIVQATSLESNALADTYETTVIARAEEWQKTVSETVDRELNEAGSLREGITHYQIKITDIKKKVEAKESNEKPVPKKLQTKLSRNEKKLEQAWKQHDEYATKVCNLLEEVTQRGWKDLYPVVKEVLNWEVSRVKVENKELASKIPALLSKLDIEHEASSIPPVDELTVSGTYSDESDE